MTNASARNRQSAGQPTGGQFATESKSADTGVTLDDPALTDRELDLASRRERAEVAVAMAQEAVRYEAEQEFVEQVRRVLPTAHAVSLHAEVEQDRWKYTVTQVLDGRSQALVDFDSHNEDSDLVEHLDDLAQDLGDRTDGPQRDLKAVVHDPHGANRPLCPPLPTPDGRLPDARPLTIVFDDGLVLSHAYASSEHRDNALVGMAQRRWEGNPLVGDFEREQGGVYPTDVESAREFMAWSRPEVTIAETH